MLGDSSGGGGVQLGTRISSPGAAPTAAASSRGAHEAHLHHQQLEIGGGGEAGASSNSGGEDDNHGGGGNDGGGGSGNRWPRQETLALLKIRSDMDVAFRDANVKGPLWEGVSRKLAELGYHRNAKKCKEKFENVYKYHRRTKESRTGKSEGKNYRFFEELQALDHQHQHNHHNLITNPPPQLPQNHPLMAPNITNTVPSNPSPINAMPQSILPPPPAPSTINFTNTPPVLPPTTTTAATQLNTMANPFSSSFGTDISTSSSTSSDVELGGMQGRKRKRKWKDFFERLMTVVIDKQEELQKKFLEAIEKRERERMVREEAWRVHEMSRINREREILAQERSMAAAKDAAVMAFLQKFSQQPNNNIPLPQPPQPQPTQHTPTPPPPQTLLPPVTAPPPPQPPPAAAATTSTPPPAAVSHRPPPQPLLLPQPGVLNLDNGGDDQIFTPTSGGSGGASSSRWPKVEVEALIKIRTSLDSKYQENGPKGPLWEEISSAMKKVGYNRNSKRCKEKWENINKYFKKVKESNKKRLEDSKTCPYFHQLDALYKEKNKIEGSNSTSTSTSNSIQPPAMVTMKPENSVLAPPLMVRPEKQWPPAAPRRPPELMMHRPDLVIEDQNLGEEDDDDDMEDEDDDDDGGGFEIVANKNVVRELN